ncbi:MAG: DEAD/DEAH box helicase [Bacteroidetes bacterium]|nr:DEAD/DEAH box helicase [Bacteroidota bacterium]
MIDSFQDMGLSQPVYDAITDLGYVKPTPIQQQAIPVLLQGTRDFVGLAQTGTGKTAAFGLPLLSLIDTSRKEVQGLVICPTRELCIQIANDFKAFGKYMDEFYHVAVYGGSSIENQIKYLKKGVQIVVATPGRLIDLLERRAVKLDAVTHVVLDEADEMLNMGFREDIEHILSHATSREAAWLFSATMPKEVRRIAETFMEKPFEIKVNSNETAKNIRHVYYQCQSSHKYETLKRLIDYNPGMYGIIFTRTKMEAQDIAEKLMKEGYEIDALHGDLSQQQRDKVMGRFREKTLNLLIATDVAARGIDVDSITHVINYALPDEPEVYTHRSGRTARAGKSGVCMSILHSRETGRLRDIEHLTKSKFEKLEIPSGREVCEKQFYAFIERLHNADISHGDYENYLPYLKEQFADMSKDEILQRVASLEFNRFLKYYEKASDLNSSDRQRSNGNYTRLFISLGEKDGFYKAAFLEFLLDTSGHKKAQLGKIELMDSYSFVEVDHDIAEEFIAAFNGKKFRGRPIRIEASSDRTNGGKGRKGRNDRFGRGESRGSRDSRGQRSGGGSGDRNASRKKEKRKFWVD